MKKSPSVFDIIWSILACAFFGACVVGGIAAAIASAAGGDSLLVARIAGGIGAVIGGVFGFLTRDDASDRIDTDGLM